MLRALVWLKRVTSQFLVMNDFRPSASIGVGAMTLE